MSNKQWTQDPTFTHKDLVAEHEGFKILITASKKSAPDEGRIINFTIVIPPEEAQDPADVAGINIGCYHYEDGNRSNAYVQFMPREKPVFLAQFTRSGHSMGDFDLHKKHETFVGENCPPDDGWDKYNAHSFVNPAQLGSMEGVTMEKSIEATVAPVIAGIMQSDRPNSGKHEDSHDGDERLNWASWPNSVCNTDAGRKTLCDVIRKLPELAKELATQSRIGGGSPGQEGGGLLR